MGMDVIFQWAQMTRVGLYAMSKGRLKGPHFFWYVNMRVYVKVLAQNNIQHFMFTLREENYSSSRLLNNT